jgi:trimethylamine--corrinoid protein Co-methyltransferase
MLTVGSGCASNLVRSPQALVSAGDLGWWWGELLAEREESPMPSDSTGSDLALRLSVLKPAEIERIHELSLKLLEETGIIVYYPPARELLRSEGASVDETRQLVHIPRRLVEQSLETAPRRVTLTSRNDPGKDCLMAREGGHYARTTTGLNWIIDFQATKRRPVTEQDVVNWTRVIQASPNIHVAGSLNDQEKAAKSEEVRCLARMLHYTDKPLMFSAFSGEGMRWLGRLTEVAQTDGRQPRLMVLSSVNSPLIYGWGQCEAAMVSAEVGIPVCFNSSAVAGVTGPTTLAGNVVQMNTEMLAALTIIQLHRPGAPVIYAAHPMVMDMKTGMSSISVGEVGLMSAACIEIGRAYGLPTSSNGVTTDSCSPDPMATIEKWATGYPPLMAGANVNGGAGSLACVGTVSLEQLVIDDDLYGHMFRHLRGIQVDEGTLAADLIAQVGPSGAFIMEEHTLTHFRDEYYYSPLANRMSGPAWEAAGSRDAVERAAQKVREILVAPGEPFLSEEQSREVNSLLAQAEETLADLELHI